MGNTDKCSPRTADHAVAHVSRGESEQFVFTKTKRKVSINWSEFWHMLFVWLICGIVIFLVLLTIEMSRKSDNVIRDLIMRIDTISLMLSLVLSAGLEQVWDIRKNFKYKLMQLTEILLALFGIILYLAYSLWEIYDPTNPFYTDRFLMNLIYILGSSICVVFGFIMRAKTDNS